MYLRAPRGKVLIQPDTPCIAADGLGSYATDAATGLLLPETYVMRDEAQTGTVLAVHSNDRNYLTNDRVLFNKYAAREIEDGIVAVRTTDIYADGTYAPVRCLGDVVLICPLPPDDEQTAAGIFLPEVWRKQREQGFNPDTERVMQVGFGRLIECSQTANCWTSEALEPWVLFEYRRAAYHSFNVADTDGNNIAVEHVFVHDDGHTLLAVIDHATVIREAGMRAERIASYRYGNQVTAL